MEETLESWDRIFLGVYSDQHLKMPLASSPQGWLTRDHESKPKKTGKPFGSTIVGRKVDNQRKIPFQMYLFRNVSFLLSQKKKKHIFLILVNKYVIL